MEVDQLGSVGHLAATSRGAPGRRRWPPPPAGAHRRPWPTAGRRCRPASDPWAVVPARGRLTTRSPRGPPAARGWPRRTGPSGVGRENTVQFGSSRRHRREQGRAGPGADEADVHLPGQHHLGQLPAVDGRHRVGHHRPGTGRPVASGSTSATGADGGSRGPRGRSAAQAGRAARRRAGRRPSGRPTTVTHSVPSALPPVGDLGHHQGGRLGAGRRAGRRRPAPPSRARPEPVVAGGWRPGRRRGRRPGRRRRARPPARQDERPRPSRPAPGRPEAKTMPSVAGQGVGVDRRARGRASRRRTGGRRDRSGRPGRRPVTADPAGWR